MKKKVFIVDDNETNLMMARDALEKDFSVITIISGERLFTILNKILPDIILLDIEMPGMSGYKVIGRLKANEAYASIPVVFITGIQGEDILDKAREAGAVGVIHKPFICSELPGMVLSFCELPIDERT